MNLGNIIDKKIKIIAETAWHHDGDFLFFSDLVKSISKETAANYIKFHVSLDVDEYMHNDHPAYQWAKERVFSKKQWTEIFNIALTNNKKLMLLFNDKKSIDFGMKYKPDLVEIHSVCLNDIKLLNHLKNNIDKETEIVLGVGGSSLYEIENAISIIQNNNIVLMHGFQNYPTKYEDINLTRIKKIIQLFPKYKHGYADHTAWDNENNILITLFGAAIGMDYIEKHVTIKFGKERVDWQAAISIDMFNDLTTKLKVLSAVYGDGTLKLNEGEKSYSTFGQNKKAAILTQNVSKGEILTADVIAFKRTKQQTDLSQINIIDNFGSKFKLDLKEGHCINKQDIEKL